jgi:hypothetical protein
VTSEAQADGAQRWFAGRCRSVRVAPFLDGTPCNIHGFATDDGVAVFRPVEAITLRSADPPTLHYGGAATYFDPPEADRARMRIMARRVGSLLRDEVGFRGCYTIDGVLTGDGFRPTEVNPRLGAGFTPLVGGVPDLPFVAFHWAVAAGWPCPVPPDEREEAIVAAADAHRAGGGWVAGKRCWRATRQHPVVVTDDGCEPARDADEANGLITTGPSSQGGFIRFDATPGATPVGPPLAPRAASAYAWADRALGAGIGVRFRAAPARPPARAPESADRGHPPERMPTASGAVLRRARPADADAFAEAVGASPAHLRRWMPWALPVAAEAPVQRDRLVMADASWADGTDYEFAILPIDERGIIGGLRAHAPSRSGGHRDRLLGPCRPHSAGPRHRGRPGTHRCGVGAARRRTGGDPLRRGQQGQRGGAGPARLPTRPHRDRRGPRTAAFGSHHGLGRQPSPGRQDSFGSRWSSSASIGTRSCAIESRSRTVTARSSSVSKSMVTQ